MLNRRQASKALLAAATFQGGVLSRPASSAPPERRAQWMQKKWGMMVHWIAPGPQPQRGGWADGLNYAVDHFDVDRFVSKIAETGASWLIFTIGQNTGFYASPNKVLEELAGPEHASRRDLAREIAAGLSRLGIKFIAYLPGEIDAVDVLHKPFSWTLGRQSDFQVKYTQFIRQYALQLGELCQGWWIDGCYDWPVLRKRERNWALWGEAMRAGNENAVIAYNDGCFLEGSPYPLTSDQDFLSGECNRLTLAGPLGKAAGGGDLIRIDRQFVDSLPCVAHVLAPIDCHGRWGIGAGKSDARPIYTTGELQSIVRAYTSCGCAITLNVGVYQCGEMSKSSLRILGQLQI